MRKPRKGVVNAWDYSDVLPDSINFDTKEFIGVKPKKIEVRFQGTSPVGIAILHTSKGFYAFPFNSEDISGSDIKEYFYKTPPKNMIDSVVGGLLAVYIVLSSDAPLKEYKVSKAELQELRKRYNDYTVDIKL